MIKKFTRSKWNHSALYAGVDPDGIAVLIESTWGGVQMNPITNYDHDEILALRHKDMNDGFWDRMQGWLMYQFEKGYDYLGIVGIALNILGLGKNPFDNKKRYWCSEFVSDAYLNAGLLLDVEVNTWKVSPADLLKQQNLREVYSRP